MSATSSQRAAARSLYRAPWRRPGRLALAPRPARPAEWGARY